MGDEQHQNSEWDTEQDEDEQYEVHEAAGGDLASFWDTEAGWIESVHLMSLDELRKIGYPDASSNPGKSILSSGEKPLGSTGLNVTPKGLITIWSDLAESWNMSQAKVQRITGCHGICIYAKDSWYMDLDKVYREVKKLIRGTTDAQLLDQFETSSLIYSYPSKRIKTGGSVAFLTNRLGVVSKIQNRLAIPQTTAFVELSIASIMTLKSRKLGRWVKTIEPEYRSFRDYGITRKKALNELYNKLTNISTP